MPLSAASIVRGLVMLLMAGHVFMSYLVARTWNDSFGFDAGDSALACGFALALLLPFVWAIGLPEIPDLYVRHIRPRRWWKRGRCPGCGYDLLYHHAPRGDDADQSPDDSHHSESGSTGHHSESGGTTGTCCPECGRAVTAPAPYQFSRTMVRRFIVLALGAWLLGCAAGEAFLLADEQRFRAEVQAIEKSRPVDSFKRYRTWPSRGLLVYRWDDGFSGTQGGTAGVVGSRNSWHEETATSEPESE